MAVFLKENVVVRLFSRCIFEEAIDFLINPYYSVLAYLIIIILYLIVPFFSDHFLIISNNTQHEKRYTHHSI